MVRIEMGASTEVGTSQFFQGAFMSSSVWLLSLARRWSSQEVIREVMGPPTPLAEGISRSVTWTDVLRWFSSYLRRVVIRKRK